MYGRLADAQLVEGARGLLRPPWECRWLGPLGRNAAQLFVAYSDVGKSGGGSFWVLRGASPASRRISKDGPRQAGCRCRGVVSGIRIWCHCTGFAPFQGAWGSVLACHCRSTP